MAAHKALTEQGWTVFVVSSLKQLQSTLLQDPDSFRVCVSRLGKDSSLAFSFLELVHANNPFALQSSSAPKLPLPPAAEKTGKPGAAESGGSNGLQLLSQMAVEWGHTPLEARLSDHARSVQRDGEAQPPAPARADNPKDTAPLPRLRIASVVFSLTACSHVKLRASCLSYGTSLITYKMKELLDFCADQVAHAGSERARRCCRCHATFLTAHDFALHYERFHSDTPASWPLTCPVCSAHTAPFGAHVRAEHTPRLLRSLPTLASPPSPFAAVVVCVCPQTNKFLLVNEPECAGWCPPSAHVQAGETFLQCGVRAVWQKTGLHAQLTALLDMQTSGSDGACLPRAVVLLARPHSPGMHTLQSPTFASVDVRWFSMADLGFLHKQDSLRSAWWVPYLSRVAHATQPMASLALFLPCRPLLADTPPPAPPARPAPHPDDLVAELAEGRAAPPPGTPDSTAHAAAAALCQTYIAHIARAERRYARAMFAVRHAERMDFKHHSEKWWLRKDELSIGLPREEWDWIWDPPLTQDGLQQAVRLGQFLMWQGGVDHIISSPALRCVQTANEIAKLMDMTFYIDPCLFECGTKEWYPYATASPRPFPQSCWLPASVLQTRLGVAVNCDYKACEEPAAQVVWGEGFDAFAHRTARFVQWAMAKAKGTVLLVGHGQTVTRSVGAFPGVVFARRRRDVEPRFAAVTRVARGGTDSPWVCDHYAEDVTAASV